MCGSPPRFHGQYSLMLTVQHGTMLAKEIDMQPGAQVLNESVMPVAPQSLEADHAVTSCVGRSALSPQDEWSDWGERHGR
jgi:hypothetical protein